MTDTNTLGWRAVGCWCIRYQQDGTGPWVVIPNPHCPVHGDDDD